jgi:MYXO-CTERM domain-containing protein
MSAPAAFTKLRPRPRARAARPAYPALFCALIAAVAAAGCGDAVEDAPEGGQAEDAALADGGHAFAEAAVDDASEEGTEDQLNSGGCSAAPYQSGPHGAWAAAAIVLFLKGRRR